MRDRRRHEDVAQVTIPMRAIEPYVARAQRVAQVEHDRDFPEAGIIIALRPQLSPPFGICAQEIVGRSEEHTSELQSLMRISYAVFCLKKTNTSNHQTRHHTI